ncbi:hypothetical protein ALQ90_03779 [Pseudomonas savastanoi pv. savastanoi]|nr:hypothetical protein ALQ90_03779 [Pseudomonas savastanoi pv. savastanoi]
MTDARHPLHFEACCVQRAPHPAGAGKRAYRGARCRQARQFGKQFGCPHFRVFRWRKPVEKPRINLPVQLRQHLQRVTNQQGQGHAAVIEYQTLKAFMHSHILIEQLTRERPQLWPQRQGTLQVGAAQRVFLDADELQARIGGRALVEQLPGTEEIQPGAESGFTNDQPAVLRQLAETPTQVVLDQKHMARLVQTGLGGKVDIGEIAGTRVALFVPVYPGVAGNGHVRLSGGSGRILAVCEDKSAITAAPIDRCPQSVVRMLTEGCPPGVL